jgi:hypothetical protein
VKEKPKADPDPERTAKLQVMAAVFFGIRLATETFRGNLMTRGEMAECAAADAAALMTALDDIPD